MNRPTAEALSKKIHDAVITAILEFFAPSEQVPGVAQPENGKAAAAAILAPPAPAPPVLTDRWGAKKPDRPWEQIEVTPVTAEARRSANQEFMRVSWPNVGRGYCFAQVWDKSLFPFVEARLNQKTVFFVTRKDRFINIVGLRA